MEVIFPSCGVAVVEWQTDDANVLIFGHPRSIGRDKRFAFQWVVGRSKTIFLPGEWNIGRFFPIHIVTRYGSRLTELPHIRSGFVKSLTRC